VWSLAARRDAGCSYLGVAGCRERYALWDATQRGSSASALARAATGGTGRLEWRVGLGGKSSRHERL
jgi:hypothetical protein